MASQQSTVDFIVEQMASAGVIHTKKMFGEYAIYCHDKVVALVCDDQLFIKPTQAGSKLIGSVVEGCPYPGAKPYFLISGELWDDSDWLTQLVIVTAQELPPPKAKIPHKKRKG